MMKAIRSSETQVLTRATQPHIPEEGIPHSKRRECLISYIPEFVIENCVGTESAVHIKLPFTEGRRKKRIDLAGTSVTWTAS
jgi:hypothetical protein